ncbi:hypothetical protein S83_004048 [Arachis hypogaea]
MYSFLLSSCLLGTQQVTHRGNKEGREELLVVLLSHIQILRVTMRRLKGTGNITSSMKKEFTTVLGVQLLFTSLPLNLTLVMVGLLSLRVYLVPSIAQLMLREPIIEMPLSF